MNMPLVAFLVFLAGNVGDFFTTIRINTIPSLREGNPIVRWIAMKGGHIDATRLLEFKAAIVVACGLYLLRWHNEWPAWLIAGGALAAVAVWNLHMILKYAH